MSQPFPQHPRLSGNFAPIHMECDAPDLPVIGEIPKEISGTLYRNGPNPQFAPREGMYNWFGGDGMIHAFSIEDGRVAYRNRWVRTPKWEMEHRAGAALFPSFGTSASADPITKGHDDGTANTNVIWHAGKLLALEEGHLPFEIAADTLCPKGYQDFGGRIAGRFTAHPKIDPESGELLFFSRTPLQDGAPGMLYGVLDSKGIVTRTDTFAVPYSSFAHDFLATQKYVLFPVMPQTTNMERAKRGKPMMAWEPEKGTHVGIMRRDGSVNEMRWFHTDACYVYHFMNAWEEGNTIIADVMQYEVPPRITDPDGRTVEAIKPGARLCRWTFNLAANSNEIKREYLDDLTGDFPRFDERYSGLPYQHGFYACHLDASEAPTFSTLAHFDAKTGKRNLYTLPAGDVTSEPVFVPRSATAAEGDGWLLATAWRNAERRSDLLVFKAGDITAGPIASVQLSHRIPFGFHGNWKPN
jgi:carotenoid cleavage dioxygenase